MTKRLDEMEAGEEDKSLSICESSISEESNIIDRNSLENLFKPTNHKPGDQATGQSHHFLTSSSVSRSVIGDIDLVLYFEEIMNLRRLCAEVSGFPRTINMARATTRRHSLKETRTETWWVLRQKQEEYDIGFGISCSDFASGRLALGYLAMATQESNWYLASKRLFWKEKKRRKKCYHLIVSFLGETSELPSPYNSSNSHAFLSVSCVWRRYCWWRWRRLRLRPDSARAEGVGGAEAAASVLCTCPSRRPYNNKLLINMYTTS